MNRVIAGVHFPVDLAAGMVFGLMLGRYFVKLADGAGDDLLGYKFDAEQYGDRDFPWRDIFNAVETGSKLGDFLKPRRISFTIPENNRKHSPLSWLWHQAKDEWK